MTSLTAASLATLIAKRRRGRWLRAVWPLLLVAVAYVAWAFAHLDAYAFSNDEGMPLMWARLMRDGYSLYRDIWSDHPPALQWLMVAVFGVLGETVAAVQVGRAVIVLVSTLGMLAVGGVAWLATGSRWAGLAAVLALTLSPLFNWFSRALMPDVPAAALVAVALLLALQARGRVGLAVWSGSLYGLSLVVKLISLPLAPVVLLGLWLGQPRRSLLRLTLAWAIGLAAPVGVTLLFIDIPAAYQSIIGTVVGAREAGAWQAAEVLERIRAFLAEGHLGLVALAGVGIFAVTHDRKPAGLTLLAWLGLMTLALAVHHPLYEHHLALVLFALTGLAGVGAACLSRPGLWRLGAGVALLVYAVTAPTALRLGFVPATPRDADNWQLVADIQQVTRANDWTITDSTLFAFRAGLRIPPPLVTGGKRLESGLLTNAALAQGTAQWRPTSIVFIRSGDVKLPYVDWVDHTYTQARRWSATRRAWTPAPGGPLIDLTPRPLADGVTLQGYSLPTARARPGEALRLGLFWSAARPWGEDDHVFAHLVGPDGRVAAQDGGLLQDDGSTRWQPGVWTLDRRTLNAPTNLAPGDYALEVGVSRAPSGERAGDAVRLPVVVRVE